MAEICDVLMGDQYEVKLRASAKVHAGNKAAAAAAQASTQAVVATPEPEPNPYANWKEVSTADGQMYYHNVVTNETQWQLPGHVAPEPQLEPEPEPQYLADKLRNTYLRQQAQPESETQADVVNEEDSGSDSDSETESRPVPELDRRKAAMAARFASLRSVMADPQPAPEPELQPEPEPEPEPEHDEPVQSQAAVGSLVVAVESNSTTHGKKPTPPAQNEARKHSLAMVDLEAREVRITKAWTGLGFSRLRLKDVTDPLTGELAYAYVVRQVEDGSGVPADVKGQVLLAVGGRAILPVESDVAAAKEVNEVVIGDKRPVVLNFEKKERYRQRRCSPGSVPAVANGEEIDRGLGYPAWFALSTGERSTLTRLGWTPDTWATKQHSTKLWDELDADERANAFVKFGLGAANFSRMLLPDNICRRPAQLEPAALSEDNSGSDDEPLFKSVARSVASRAVQQQTPLAICSAGASRAEPRQNIDAGAATEALGKDNALQVQKVLEASPQGWLQYRHDGNTWRSGYFRLTDSGALPLTLLCFKNATATQCLLSWPISTGFVTDLSAMAVDGFAVKCNGGQNMVLLRNGSKTTSCAWIQALRQRIFFHLRHNDVRQDITAALMLVDPPLSATQSDILRKLTHRVDVTSKLRQLVDMHHSEWESTVDEFFPTGFSKKIRSKFLNFAAYTQEAVQCRAEAPRIPPVFNITVKSWERNTTDGKAYYILQCAAKDKSVCYEEVRHRWRAIKEFHNFMTKAAKQMPRAYTLSMPSAWGGEDAKRANLQAYFEKLSTFADALVSDHQFSIQTLPEVSQFLLGTEQTVVGGARWELCKRVCAEFTVQFGDGVITADQRLVHGEECLAKLCDAMVTEGVTQGDDRTFVHVNKFCTWLKVDCFGGITADQHGYASWRRAEADKQLVDLLCTRQRFDDVCMELSKAAQERGDGDPSSANLANLPALNEPLERAVVLVDYKATDGMQLTLEENTVVVITAKPYPEWWLGYNEDAPSESRYIPAQYLVLLPASKGTPTSAKKIGACDKIWSEMDQRERDAVLCLGWTQQTWDASVDTPFERSWDGLSEDQRNSALMLGLASDDFRDISGAASTRGSSDSDMDEPEPEPQSVAPHPQPAWAEMTNDEVAACQRLGWTEASWVNPPEGVHPAPLNREWETLTNTERHCAAVLKFGKLDFRVVRAPTSHEPEPEPGVEAAVDSNQKDDDTFREQLAATLKAAEQDGVEWMRSKIMYVGDGRAGKSHLHKNVAGEPPVGAIDSTVGIDTLTLECKAMQTGGKAGTWSRYTCTEGIGQALQALATAGAAMQLGQVNPDYGSMSDNVDGWLAQPDGVDSAVAAASLGNMLATVLPLDDDLMQLDSAPPVPTAPVQKSQSASTLELGRAPASDSKFELQRISRAEEPEPEQEQSLHAKTPSLSSERKSFTPEPEEYEPELEEPEPEPEPEPQSWVGKASEMEDVIKIIPGCKKAWDSLILEGWDLGGQRIFYTLHHLYMTRYSIYCVLFDMRQLLPTAAKNVRTNALTVLRFWLNSIVVHTASNTEDDSCAPLVIVGTHKDLVPSPQDHMAISKVLYETFGTHPAWPSLKQNRTNTANPQDGGQKTLLWFFPLDNLAGSADPIFSAFLSTVETAVREEKYVHQRVPIAWYRMYDELQTLLLGGQPTVTFLDAVKLAKTAGLPVDPGRTVEKELRALLCFLHELGILMYFDEPGLNAVIVLDPQWLVTAATKIICEFAIHDLPEHRVAGRQHARSWNALQLKSELHVELLADLWPEHNTQTQRQLLQLMTKFGLITPQRDRAKFLVPSLLRDTEELERQMQRILETGGAIDIQHTAYFVFSLRNQLADNELVDVSQLRALGFLPVGFFPRILGKCVDWSQSTHGAPPILSPSRGIIAFGADRFMLTELQECNAIRLELFQDNVGACERVSTLIKEVIAECMPQLCSELMLSAPAVGEDTSLAYLLPLGLIRVAASTDGDQSGLWTGHRHMMQNELQAEYSLWLPSVGQLRGYDIMLSYRHQGVQDTECALKINDGCSSGKFLFGTRRRHLRVFLDAIRLSTGSQFMEDIMKAMLRSRVVCPIVSASATQRMETWRPGGERDCVLVEWLLAIELKRLGKVLTVLPILLGELTGGSMHNFFNRRDVCGKNAIDRLPNVVPTVEIAIVDGFLRENNLQASPELATRTIRQTVESLVRETLRIDTWEFFGDGELDIHGSRAAAAAAAAAADSEGNMYERCTAQVALAAQKTLEQRSEAQDDMEDARALSKDVEYHMALPPGLVNHFFLSHKQANGGPTVAWLEAKFTLRRLLSWYDNNADDRSEQGMMDGVRGAAVFVLFLTAGTIERYYVQLEIREAFRLRKPIVMIMETDERFGKPDFAAEMAAKMHVDSNTNVPIVSKQQISWLFSEVTAIPVRRQAHELPAFLDEVERQTREIIDTAGGKRPPTELMSGSVSELAQPEPEPEVQTSPPATAAGKTAMAVPIPEGIPSTPADWSVTQLSDWLTNAMSMPHVGTAVVEHEIDGGTALELVREDWIELSATGIHAGKIISGLKKKLGESGV